MHLDNTAQVEVSGLEITNQGASLAFDRRGVYAEAIDQGDVPHVVLRDLYVHDVNGCEGGSVRIGPRYRGHSINSRLPARASVSRKMNGRSNRHPEHSHTSKLTRLAMTTLTALLTAHPLAPLVVLLVALTQRGQASLRWRRLLTDFVLGNILACG